MGLGALLLASQAQAEGQPPTLFAPAAQQGDVLSTFGVHVYAGFAGGGDTLDIVTYSDGSTSSLEAGEGVSVGGGITWTPLWPTDRLGFGLGYDLGYKLGTTFSNADGTLEMERIPMSLSLRCLLGIAANYHLLVAAGGVVEFGPHEYGTGVASGFERNFSTAVGGVFDLGVLFGAPLSLGGEITGRFTAIEYDLMGTKVSGLSGGVNFGLHFFL